LKQRNLPLSKWGVRKKGADEWVLGQTKAGLFKIWREAKRGPTNWLATKELAFPKCGEAKKSERTDPLPTGSFLFQIGEKTKKAKELTVGQTTIYYQNSEKQIRARVDP